MDKKFKRDISSLDDIFQFIAKFITSNKINDANSYYLNLAIEELFTNLVKYNADIPDPILIDLSKTSDSLVIEITDKSDKPFDINKAAEYDTKQSLEKRPIGGVGLHLIKKMFDETKYEFHDKRSKITLVKFLRGTNV